jgi:hypothetical protein
MNIWRNETNPFASMVCTLQSCVPRGGISDDHTWSWGDVIPAKEIIFSPTTIVCGKLFLRKHQVGTKKIKHSPFLSHQRGDIQEALSPKHG